MTNLQQRIRQVLLSAGLRRLPDSAAESLFDYGLDSLNAVIVACELEKQFNVKIFGGNFDDSSFATLEKIEHLLENLAHP